MSPHVPTAAQLRSYAGSSIGRKRKHNEDAYLTDDELGLWVVADGMGGHAAGEVASREACDAVFGVVKRGKQKLTIEEPPSENSLLTAHRFGVRVPRGGLNGTRDDQRRVGREVSGPSPTMVGRDKATMVEREGGTKNA